MITRDPAALLAFARTLAPDFGPACARAAFLVAPEGFALAAESASDNAYMDLAQNEPTHEVAMAMIGADMDRAHARLQALIGLPRLPFTHEPSSVARREAQRLADEKH